MEVSAEVVQTLNIRAKRRDTFELNVSVTDSDGADFDFTTHTALMHVRDAASEDGTLLVTLTTADSSITLTDGTIALLKSAAGMDVEAGEYFYDLQITYPDGSVKTWLEGGFTVTDDVTV